MSSELNESINSKIKVIVGKITAQQAAGDILQLTQAAHNLVDVADRIPKGECGKAMDVLKQAMNEDPGYAYGWHCSIAVMYQDSTPKPRFLTPWGRERHRKAIYAASNEAASRFMKACFDVETSAGLTPELPSGTDYLSD